MLAREICARDLGLIVLDFYTAMRSVTGLLGANPVVEIKPRMVKQCQADGLHEDAGPGTDTTTRCHRRPDRLRSSSCRLGDVCFRLFF